jgi:hypothetical protein
MFKSISAKCFSVICLFLQICSSNLFAEEIEKPPVINTLENGQSVVPEPQDFIAEAKLLMRVVACSGDDPLPENIDPALVEQHCNELKPLLEVYQNKYAKSAKDFIASLRPPNLPLIVVYPFGGGDLLSALTSYPDATDITTISLEHVGDPRRIFQISNEKLASTLRDLRRKSWGLLKADNSTSESLSKLERCEIPGQLALFLLALSIYNYEPVSLRYFRLEQDGSTHYLSQDEISALENQTAKKLHWKWLPPDYSLAFSNMEIQFRPRNDTNAPVRIHRHIAANLMNDPMEKDPSLLHYLEKKGSVSAMTKAASYCLWDSRFSKIRDYLLDHMEFMISDSTGIPPKISQAAGFSVETYGKFHSALLKVRASTNRALLEFWESQPHRPLSFRYGYPDANGSFHMMVTYRTGTKTH